MEVPWKTAALDEARHPQGLVLFCRRRPRWTRGGARKEAWAPWDIASPAGRKARQTWNLSWSLQSAWRLNGPGGVATARRARSLEAVLFSAAAAWNVLKVLWAGAGTHWLRPRTDRPACQAFKRNRPRRASIRLQRSRRQVQHNAEPISSGKQSTRNCCACFDHDLPGPISVAF